MVDNATLDLQGNPSLLAHNNQDMTVGTDIDGDDFIIKTGGTERARIKRDGTTSGTISSGQSTDNLPSYLINPQALVNFFKSLNKTPYSQGGTAILTFGDSIGRGGNSETVLHSGMFSQIQTALQAKYNPTGVRGGRGFIPVATGSGSSWVNPTTGTLASAIWTLTGTPAYNGRFMTTPGCYVIRMNAASGNSLAITMDGSAADAEFKRSGITSFSAVTYGPNSHTVIPYTVYNNTTTTMAASGNFDGFSATGGKITSLAAGLNPLHSYTITISAPASGGNAWVTGGVAYNGDEQCGVRLHNFCNWGSRLCDDGSSSVGLLDVVGGSQVTNRATAIASNITTWASGNSFATNVNTAESRARLALIEYSGTNDEGGAVGTTLFRTAVDHLNTALLAAGISPLWICVTAPATRKITYYPYNDQVIDAAKLSNGLVAVLDVASSLNRPDYGTNAPGQFMYDRAWYGDGTHLLTGWHKFYADQTLRAIEASHEYCKNQKLI